jgi:hypothetical protein
MSYAANTAKHAIGNKFFTTTDLHGGTLKVALLTAETTVATWTGYANQTFQVTADNAGGFTLNNSSTITDPIEFVAVPAANGSETITHWGLLDVNNVVVFSQQLNSSTGQVLAVGNIAKIPASSLTVTFG